MLISRDWLQSYFTTPLPHAEEIAETLLLHSFEIEEVYEQDGDMIIDVDVLPNRAHDCLSYEGIAQEYAMLSGAELVFTRYEGASLKSSLPQPKLAVTTPGCLRYQAQLFNNVTVETSPAWVKKRLAAIGQKSINSIVDATNMLMFETGQPLHAFDADKVVGAITVRQAFDGEKMTTLGGEELELLATDIVIADDEGVLALAGVKGGTKAEVDAHTRNIILEVANFRPQSVRATSRRVKILTDSSKRFENGISSERARGVIESFMSLIKNFSADHAIEISESADYYPEPEKITEINLPHSKIESVLGLSIEREEVEAILKKLSFVFQREEDSYHVEPPVFRLDIKIAEDLIEEIGRVYGYHLIPSRSLSDIIFQPRLHVHTWAENVIKNFLTENGFSELRNYAFVSKGEVELLNPLASDKKALRSDVQKTFLEALEKNSNRADYFGSDRTMVFEIAREYHADREDLVCVIGIKNKDKKARKTYGDELEQLKTLVSQLESLLSSSLDVSPGGTSLRFSLRDIVTPSEISEYGSLFENKSYNKDAVFHGVSSYPYVTRDVSFWTEEQDAEIFFKKTIQKAETEHLKKVYLLDIFEKEGRVSYAYSLIFQSMNKTLTDIEVESDMKKIIETLEEQGCELR